MAKSKKSRRARRQEIEKQRQKTADAAVTPEVAPAVEAQPTPEAVEVAPSPKFNRKAVNFAQEYFYVYTELRNIFVIAVIMFIIMVGLLYVV